MNKLLATLLATAASSSFAFAPTAALNHDPATYRNVSQKANADYKAATAKCSRLSGNEEDICTAEAKAARARTEADAIAQYNNSDKGRAASRTKVADADYAVAKAKCGAMSGAEKDSCMETAKSMHATALADTKAGRGDTRMTANVDGKGMIANTNTTQPVKADAVDKCAQVGGTSKTGCLVDNRATAAGAAATTTATGAEMANRTENAAERTADKTRDAASTLAQKTKEVARSAVEKTKQVASNVAEKTSNAVDNAGDASRNAANRTGNAMERAGDRTRDNAVVATDKTERATERAGDKADAAAGRTAVAASDTAITTKVKAGIFAEPDLKSMAIHVETEKGVVMLSGFVDSKAEAAKAVKVAKGIEGVTKVKSAIKVK
ncbi:MAG TPA: BON domain-containing protein [Telluria sp.]